MGDSGGQHITVGSVPYPLPGSKTKVQRRAAALPVHKLWAQSQGQPVLDAWKRNPRGLRSEEIPLRSFPTLGTATWDSQKDTSSGLALGASRAAPQHRPGCPTSRQAGKAAPKVRVSRTKLPYDHLAKLLLSGPRCPCSSAHGGLDGEPPQPKDPFHFSALFSSLLFCKARRWTAGLLLSPLGLEPQSGERQAPGASLAPALGSLLSCQCPAWPALMALGRPCFGLSGWCRWLTYCPHQPPELLSKYLQSLSHAPGTVQGKQ